MVASILPKSAEVSFIRCIPPQKKLTFSDVGFFSFHFKTKLLCKKPGPYTQWNQRKAIPKGKIFIFQPSIFKGEVWVSGWGNSPYLDDHPIFSEVRASTNHGDRCCPLKFSGCFWTLFMAKKNGGGILTTKWGPHPPTNLPFSFQPPLYGRFQHRNPGDVGHVLDRKIHLRESSASKWWGDRQGCIPDPNIPHMGNPY